MAYTDEHEYIYAPENLDGSEGLIAIIVRKEYTRTDGAQRPIHGVKFFTNSRHSLQLAFMSRPAGHVVAGHTHQRIPRQNEQLQEVLFVRTGRVRLYLFTSAGERICERELGDGDVVMLVSGGHGLEFLEETELFEVKLGPYMGPQDKIMLGGG